MDRMMIRGLPTALLLAFVASTYAASGQEAIGLGRIATHDRAPGLPQELLNVDTRLATVDLPRDYAAEEFGDAPVLFVSSEACCDYGLLYDLLEPARFCHRPLYFEDCPLERCGRCCGRCPNAASAVHFFGSCLCLPCKIYRQPCDSCVRTPHPLCCRQ